MSENKIQLIRKYKLLTILTLVLLSLIYIGFEYFQTNMNIGTEAVTSSSVGFTFLAMMLISAVAMIFSLFEKLNTDTDR